VAIFYLCPFAFVHWKCPPFSGGVFSLVRHCRSTWFIYTFRRLYFGLENIVRAFTVRRPGGRLCKVFLVAAAALETDIKFYCSCCHGFSRRSWGCLLARGGGWSTCSRCCCCCCAVQWALKWPTGQLARPNRRAECVCIFSGGGVMDSWALKRNFKYSINLWY